MLARHRKALQQSVLVRAGQLTWKQVHENLMPGVALRFENADIEEAPWMSWFRGDRHVEYPSVGQRAIATLAQRLRAYGTELLVVESPAHPIIDVSRVRRRAAVFRERMAEQAERDGFGFIPATEFEAFEIDDFEDMIHLGPTGRERFTRQLAAHLQARSGLR